MRSETSLYLDAVRFMAALVVFAGHVGARSIGGGPGWQASGYGAPAVVVFFVLSGFVIGYVTDSRETSGWDYAIARAARLYSVVVPALVLTALLDGIGAYIVPALYIKTALLGDGAWHLPVSLLFLNEAWSVGITPGSNGPYWSLSYEVAYYVMFGCAFYLRSWPRMLALLLVASIAGPRIVALLPLWLLGWAAYRACARWTIKRRLGWGLFAGSIGAAVAANWWARRYGMLVTSHSLFDCGPAEVAQVYILALIVAVHLLGFNAIGSTFSGVARRIDRPVRWLAGGSFTLYLVHVPVVLFVRSLIHGMEGTPAFSALILIVPLTVSLAIAQVTEQHKGAWKRVLRRIFVPVAAG